MAHRWLIGYSKSPLNKQSNGYYIIITIVATLKFHLHFFQAWSQKRSMGTANPAVFTIRCGQLSLWSIWSRWTGRFQNLAKKNLRVSSVFNNNRCGNKDLERGSKVRIMYFWRTLTNELAKKAKINILPARDTTRPGFQAGASWFGLVLARPFLNKLTCL